MECTGPSDRLKAEGGAYFFQSREAPPWRLETLGFGQARSVDIGEDEQRAFLGQPQRDRAVCRMAARIAA